MNANQSADLLVIGAGPAGIAAALAAAGAGLDVLMADEQPRVGGQIARQPPAQFTVDDWLPGKAYREQRRLVAAIEAAPGIRRLHAVTIWGIFAARDRTDGFEIMGMLDGRGLRICADRVIVATGCYELPVAFPGWTLPGVMSVGAVQTLLKSQRLVPRGRTVLAGSHPLMLILAGQLAAAGHAPAAVVFHQPWHAAAALLRRPLLAWRGRQALIDAATAMARLRASATEIVFGALPVQAEGDGRLEQVRIRSANGRERRLACDTLAICFGFLPSSELARQAGARDRRLANGEWVIETDGAMRTSVAGLYAAGETRGVAGAEVAAAEGSIAGLTAAADAGHGHGKIAAFQRTASRRRAFATELRRLSTVPNSALLALITPTTIVCRCESVNAAQVDAALADNPTAHSASAVKLIARTGMGLCQGRMCEHTVSRLLARARQQAWPQPDGYVVRAPVKPVPIGALLAEPGLKPIDPVEIERRHAAIQQSEE